MEPSLINSYLDDLHQRRVSLKLMAGNRAKTLHQEGLSGSPMFEGSISYDN